VGELAGRENKWLLVSPFEQHTISRALRLTNNFRRTFLIISFIISYQPNNSTGPDLPLHQPCIRYTAAYSQVQLMNPRDRKDDGGGTNHKAGFRSIHNVLTRIVYADFVSPPASVLSRRIKV
jgi:hypothetical protein